MHSSRQRESRSRTLSVVLAVMVGGLAVLGLARWLAFQPHWDATWNATPQGNLELTRTAIGELQPWIGQSWIGSAAGTSPRTDPALQPEALLLEPSGRWIVDDARRQRQVALNDRLAAAQRSGPLSLQFSDLGWVTLTAAPRGWSRLGAAFWLFSTVGWMLTTAAAAVLLAKPSASSALYALMAACQAANLACAAIVSTASPLLPLGYAGLDFPLRVGFDLATLAAAVHLACTHPRRLSSARWMPLVAWVAAFTVWLAIWAGAATSGWWLAQGTLATLGACAVMLMHRSFAEHPHPFALVMKRFSLVIGCTWLLVSLAVVAAAEASQPRPPSLASVPQAVAVWQVLFALVLLSLPFLSKAHSAVRELSLLAIISALATVFDLLFIGLFSLDPFASLTLTLFLSLAIYAGARQWLVSRMLGTRVASTERLFEQLFRATREVEIQPTQAPAALARLLEDLFDPKDVEQIDKPAAHAHPLSDGAAMLVPVPSIPGGLDPGSGTSILLRHAQQGRRLFTVDDARLADRLAEQLRRAVAFDQAVEQGRSEERRRLAQDLHDDIGARLLTLMYKAQSPEMEDYARHTLQDLKTLTRGLAASNQLLSHALAEWKADITQRLGSARIELQWSAEQDADVVLNMVQWSGLTRVLRELVSNVMAHANARCVEIAFRLAGDRLEIRVQDDGTGASPQSWAPGLGLGGVRKRVRQLGGEVSWQVREPRGIACQVVIERLSSSN